MWNISLPVAHVEMNVLLLSGFGLVVGFLAGLFGVGGGFFMTPLLMALGVPPEVAVGSGLAIMLGASISGTVRHAQLGNVDFKLAMVLLAGSFIGVQVGAMVLQALKGMETLRLYSRNVDATYFFLSLSYMVLLFGIGIGSILKTASDNGSGENGRLARWLRRWEVAPYVSLRGSGVERYPVIFLLAGGLLIGILAGLLGVGGGIIMMPFMMYIVGLKTQRAVGTSLCQICFTAAVGAVTHAFHGHVDAMLVIVVLAWSLIGARLGASTSSLIPSATLRRYFGLFVLVVGLVVCVSFLHKVFRGI